MSFKCDVCKKVSPPRVAQHKKIIEIRLVKYNNKCYNKEKEEEFVKTTEGNEIVKEFNVCGSCV